MSVEVRLSNDPLAPGPMLEGFCAGGPQTGAVVSFTGLVRDDGGVVEALELDAYPGFTEAAIAKIAADALERFNLQRALVAHRIGRMGVGEAAVFVAAAAAHRREAFDGAAFLMDYLKSRAPFWKKSHEADGARWIEPTSRDYEDAARWEGTDQT